MHRRAVCMPRILRATARRLWRAQRPASNVQRPALNIQCSTLARIAPPCILRRVFPHRAFAALVLLANGRDPHERFNLVGQPAQANTQRALADKLDEFFKRQADPKYDM